MTLLLTVTVGALAGAAAGGLLVWWHSRRSIGSAENQADNPDEWVSAEIDQAAATWAMNHGCPEAAPLLADKLRLLHKLGSHRRSR